MSPDYSLSIALWLNSPNRSSSRLRAETSNLERLFPPALERKNKRAEKGLSAPIDPMNFLGTNNSVSENVAQLFHDFLFRMGARDGKLLDQQIARRIQHLSLAEGEFFIALQDKKVT